MKDTYKSLFIQIANNSPKAFELFFDYSYTKLYRYANYFINDVEECKEIVSEVYYNLWQNRKKLVDLEDMDNYLFICVRNQALKHIRDINRYQKVSIENIYTDILSDKSNPEKQLLGEELSNTIELAVNSLPERCKLIFFMVREEEMKYKDVAKILSISERTVHAQMCIAIKKISALIREYQLGNEVKSIKEK